MVIIIAERSLTYIIFWTLSLTLEFTHSPMRQSKGFFQLLTFLRHLALFVSLHIFLHSISLRKQEAVYLLSGAMECPRTHDRPCLAHLPLRVWFYQGRDLVQKLMCETVWSLILRFLTLNDYSTNVSSSCFAQSSHRSVVALRFKWLPNDTEGRPRPWPPPIEHDTGWMTPR